MRGKGLMDAELSNAVGITPACAGKSAAQSLDRLCAGDHPRVCGEKGKEPGLIQKTEGSPPRVRGKAVQMGVRLVQPGITPAYAGKRAASAREAYFICGSPPRVRGKGQTGCEVVVELGITPAYAGKSARRQAGPPGPAPPPQMRSGWSPPPCTGRQCRTRKSTHARRARIPAPAHTPAPQ